MSDFPHRDENDYRAGRPSPTRPPATRTSLAVAVPIIIAVIGTAIAVALLIQPGSRGGSNGTQHHGADPGIPASAEPGRTAQSTSGEASAAMVVVNVTGVESYMNVSSVNKWASDVNNRDEESLVRKCWTYPRTYIRERYLSSPSRIADLMGRTPQMTQAGPRWAAGNDADRALVAWAEAKSDYACPEIEFAEDNGVRDDLILYRAKRYILRAQGNPVNGNDSDRNYPLACEFVTGVISNIQNANPDDMAMVSSSDSHWVVRAGDVMITMHQEPGVTCVESAR